MSKCELLVLLDEPERPYRCGETVSGRVQVRTDGEVICKQLMIEQVWQTHGRGNCDAAGFLDQVATDQRWLPGQVYEVPFSFPVPAAPVTHRGHLINVDHYVEARADLPWKIDPRSSADYLVVAGAETPARYVETEAEFEKAAQEAKAKKGKKRSIGGTIATIVFAPLLAVLAVLIVAMLIVLLAIVLPFALIALLVRWVRQSSAERKLGAVQVMFETSKVEKGAHHHASAGPSGAVAGIAAGIKRRMGRLGGATYLVQIGRAVPVSLRFTPKSEVELESVELVLKATESARSGSGTNATTHTHVLVEERQQLSGPLRLSPGHPIDLRGEIFLPPGSAASFRASDNNVVWEAKIAVAIANWPDWVQTNKLLVVPTPED
jgi:hypothetical protein